MASKFKYGNTAASSLLKQADATYKKQQEYKDAVASYNFYISAAHPEDFNAYASYLKDRISKVQSGDPSKALSLQRTMEEAYRRFNSQEISRATLAVNYGQIGNREKYARIMGLYQNALDNGDDALAARLESNLASLSITIQNEDDAAARAGGSGGGGRRGGGGGGSSTKDFDNALKHYDQQLSKGQLTPADYFKKAAQVYSLKEQSLITAANAGSDSAASALETLRANDTFQKMTSPDVQAKLSRGEVPLAIKRDQAGNLKYEFIKEKDQRAVLGPDGKPMKYSDLKDDQGNQLYPDDNRILTQGSPIIGYAGDKEFQRARKFSTDPNSPNAIFQYGILPKDRPTDLNKIYDFTSGRQMVLSNKGEGKNAKGDPADYAYVLGADGNPIPGTDPYGLAGAGGDPTKVKPLASDMAPAPSLKEFYGPALKGAVEHPIATAGRGLRGAANAFTGALRGIGNPGSLLTSLFAGNEKKKIDDARKAAAEAARQAAIRQAQEENRRLAAQIQAQAAAAAARRPVSVVSKAYIPPGQAQRTVAQNYAAGSGGKSTPVAVARGIGEVVGYNKLLKGIGLF